MQDARFEINVGSFAYIPAEVEAETSDEAFYAFLMYGDAVARRVRVAVEVSVGELRLRLYVEAVFIQRYLFAVFGAERYARVFGLARYAFAVAVADCEVVVPASEFEDEVEITAAFVDLREVEADGLALVVAVAAGVGAVALAVAERHAAEPGVFRGLADYSVVADLLVHIFVAEAGSAAEADFAPAESKPRAVVRSAAFAKISHPLHELVVLRAPRVVVEGGG